MLINRKKAHASSKSNYLPQQHQMICVWGITGLTLLCADAPRETSAFRKTGLVKDSTFCTPGETPMFAMRRFNAPTAPGSFRSSDP
jgi:hypothetical protein